MSYLNVPKLFVDHGFVFQSRSSLHGDLLNTIRQVGEGCMLEIKNTMHAYTEFFESIFPTPFKLHANLHVVRATS
jgi:hypothetical protein